MFSTTSLKMSYLGWKQVDTRLHEKIYALSPAKTLKTRQQQKDRNLQCFEEFVN